MIDADTPMFEDLMDANEIWARVAERIQRNSTHRRPEEYLIMLDVLDILNDVIWEIRSEDDEENT